MGDEPPHGTGPGEVPTQGSSTDHWEAVTNVIGWQLGISTTLDGDAGSGV